MAQAQALSGQAKRAELYREEAEGLRERAGRLPRLQEELRRCRERLHAAEVFKGQLEVRWGRGWRRSMLAGVIWRRGLQEASGQEKSRSSLPCLGDRDSRVKWVRIQQVESRTSSLGWADGREKRRRLWKGKVLKRRMGPRVE